MIAKKKSPKHKKIKQGKAVSLDLAKMSGEEIKQHLESLIAKGHAKEAIQAVQQLHLADVPEYALLRMRANAARARQLEAKGLKQEADLLLEALSLQLSKMNSLECREIAQVIAEAPLDFGVHYYERHQKLHSTCPSIERALADRVVLSNGWESLGSLPDEHPLKKDGLVMAEAIVDLDAAHWQEGLAKLEPLSRKSLFAPWKLFAKAMACAYKGEEEDLQRALKQIPEDFPLRSTVQILREKGCRGVEPLCERVRKPDEEMAKAIVKAIGGQDRHLPQLITQFAQALFPQNPGMAVRSLSETVAFALAKRDVRPERIGKLIPPDFLKPILMRLQMFAPQAMDSDAVPFCLASQYMKSFDLEAPYLGERLKVEAAVYFYLLAKIFFLQTPAWVLPHRDRSCLRQWIEKPDLEDNDIYLAALEKITRMVPDVDAYYLMVKDLKPSSLSTAGKELFEQIMLRMRKQFPENPFSYLQLARLYRSKGAYRKSQKILEEAWKQAPYDPQVREHYGLGLLKAAMMGRKRKSFDIARKDLEEAVRLNVKNLIPLTQAIQATLTFTKERDAEAALATLIALPDPVVRFRSLIYFHLDLKESMAPGAETLAKAVKQRVHKDLKTELKHLSDSDLIEIIAPLSEDFAYLIGFFDELDFFGDLWGKIISKFDDQHVLNIYVRLLANEEDFVQIKWVKKDLKARLKHQKNNVFFQFLSVMADYLLDEDNGSDDFFRLVNRLKEEEVQKLKDFARKIASSFNEPLSNALGSFNFNMLDVDDFMFGSDFFDDDDEDEFDDEWDDDDDYEPVIASLLGGDPAQAVVEGLKRAAGNKEMLQFMFEMLVSQMSEMKLDDEILREMGRSMEKRGKNIVQLLRQIYTGKNAKRIGREGRLLLFPDKD